MTEDLFGPHYSTIIYRGYLKALLELHDASTLDACFNFNLGVGLDYLLDQNNWLSETGSERFYECVERIEPGNLALDFSAGKKSLSVQDLGVFTQFLSNFISIETLISSAIKAQKKINKVDGLSLRRTSKKLLVIQVESARETRHLRRIASNWAGFLTEFPSLFGFSGAKTAIRIMGSKTFEIDLELPNRMVPSIRHWLLSGPRGKIRLSAIAGLFSLQICLLKGGLLLGLALFLASAIQIILEIQSLRRKNLEKENLDQLLTSAEERYSALHESKKQVDDLYKKTRLISSVATKVVEAQTPEEVVHLATSRLHDELGYDRALFFLKNDESNTLDLLTGYGIPEALRTDSHSLRFQLNDDTGNPDHIVNIFKSGESRLVKADETYLKSLSLLTRTFIETAGIREFLALPVSTPFRKLGVLFVTSETPSVRFDDRNIEILTTIANHLAMSIEKSLKLEEEVRLRTLFESYVSAEVIEDSGKGTGKLRARNGIATILFCDLRGFTKIMNQKRENADSGFKLIQAFYETVNDAVYSRGGFVNKFLGDGALAVFEVKKHNNPAAVARSAIEAALQIQNRAPEMDGTQLQISAGLHLGPVVFATVGKPPKLEFTVLGDAVNLSSRLCNLSKELENQILITEELRRALEQTGELKALGDFKIKGIENEVEVFAFNPSS